MVGTVPTVVTVPTVTELTCPARLAVPISRIRRISSGTPSTFSARLKLYDQNPRWTSAPASSNPQHSSSPQPAALNVPKGCSASEARTTIAPGLAARRSRAASTCAW